LTSRFAEQTTTQNIIRRESKNKKSLPLIV
jgi:hypothetical protein